MVNLMAFAFAFALTFSPIGLGADPLAAFAFTFIFRHIEALLCVYMLFHLIFFCIRIPRV